MDIQHTFCLKGMGILDNIIKKDSKFIAQIRAINIASQDEIYLDCNIPSVYQRYLFDLLPKVKKGNQLLLSFEAEYQQFETTFSYPNDKNHVASIIKIGCELITINSCTIQTNSLNSCDFPVSSTA